MKMSEWKPILFSGPMVKAILDGRKTMTRRVVKLPKWAAKLDSVGEDGYTLWCESADSGSICPALPRYLPGDLLWVREAHAIVGNVDPGFVLYRANGYEAECERHGFDKPYPPEAAARWRPSIHMPRWASRITLRVTAVKVERLQDISEDDAEAEGCDFFGDQTLAYKGKFAELWKSINGPGAWDANPWVAAYSFERVKP